MLRRGVTLCVVFGIVVACSSSESASSRGEAGLGGTSASGGAAGVAAQAGAAGSGGADASAGGAADSGVAGADASTGGVAGAGGSAGAAGAAGAASNYPLITFDSLDSAYAALQSGATDVALSVEGREHFKRTIAPNGDETSEVTIDGQTVLRTTDTGNTSHTDTDTNGDGAFDWQLDVVRGPTATDRQMVFNSDPYYVGHATRRLTVVQTGPDTEHVKLEIEGASGFATVIEGDSPILQEASGTSLTMQNCSAIEQNLVQQGVKTAINDGVACLQHYGATKVVDKLVQLLAAKGIEVTCDDQMIACGESSNMDTVCSRVFGPSLGSTASLTVGSSLGAPGGCSSPALVVFHELLHLATGLMHIPPVDSTSIDSRATDVVYSCADICFLPEATKCECAKCLDTEVDDPRCAGFKNCGQIYISHATCVANGSCPCGITQGQMMYLKADGLMRTPVGGDAILPNPSADPTAVTLSCGEWTPAPGDAFGQGVACRREAGHTNVTGWSVNAKIACECAPGQLASFPVYASVYSKSPLQGGQLIEQVSRTVTCP